MADFLRGFLSAKPIRDPAADMMRAAAGEDYRQQLRQRRVMRELPGFMRGDPAAEMSLAALGIGRGPESQREQERYAAAQQRSEQAAAFGRQKFEWEKQFSKEGRELAKTRAESAAEAIESRFETEMGFKKEQAEKADLRARAAAESKEFDKLEAERIRKEEQAYQRTRQAESDKRAASAARRAAKSFKFQMNEAERLKEERLKKDIINKNHGAAIRQMLVTDMDKYIGPKPTSEELQTSEGSIREARRIKLEGEMHQFYMMAGGESKDATDRMRAYQMTRDKFFGPQIMEEEVRRQAEMASQMKIVQAEYEERAASMIEKGAKQREKERKKREGMERRREKTREKIERRKIEAAKPRVAPWVPGLRPGTREQLPEQRGAIEDILRSLPAGPAGAQILDMLGL